jgi:hypothetical protein
MTTLPNFRYHTASLRLLDGKPQVSPSAIARIKEAEERCGQNLPAALTEWYQLLDADRWLGDERFGCEASSLDEVLEELRRRSKSPGRSIPLWTYSSQSSGYDAQVIPDGSDDPLVDEHRSSATERSTFSRFVQELVWGKLTAYTGLHAAIRDFGGWLGPPYLDYLRENFEELSRKTWLGFRNPFTRDTQTELWEFRFFGAGGRIRVLADGNPSTGERASCWTVHADDDNRLLALLRRLWPERDVRWEFYANDEINEELRQRFASVQ